MRIITNRIVGTGLRTQLLALLLRANEASLAGFGLTLGLWKFVPSID